MASIKVINPGMYTTIQDLGRTGYQEYGVTVSGSMDQFAHRIANLLVGNNQNEALLEMTIMGGSFIFNSDTFISITGADMKVMLNNTNRLDLWRTIKIQKGDKITFGAVKNGCRSYLAIAGGFELPTIMNSKSTYVRGKFGGFKGRALKKDDEILLNNDICNEEELSGRFIDLKTVPKYNNKVNIRVILGPQDDEFSEEGISDFLNNPYKVSSEFDRMGYRLEGTEIKHLKTADIISDGIVKGAIQIPGKGQPIIMLADCQTTGGYTKIAHVISSDLWKIAQLKPGDEINFIKVDIKKAHEILKEQENTINNIIKGFDKQRLKVEKNLKIAINNKTFIVKVNEISETY